MILSDLSISRPVLALMATVALIIFGLISFNGMPIEDMPNIDFPYITITTVYPGASPESVETEITKKIEDEVATLPGVKKLTSTSAENVSLVFIEYELNVNINNAAQDVRDRMARLQQSLPDTAKVPVAEKLDVMSSSVLEVAVSSESTPQDIAVFVEDTIKPKLESIPGVGSVRVEGIREREVRIWLDPDKMSSYDVTPQQVVGAIKMNHIDIPGGRVETGTREYAIITSGQLKSVKEFENIIVATVKGTLVRLSDVARVEDGLSDLRSTTRLNGQQAIGLSIIKQPGANVIQVADEAYKAINEIKSQLPPSVKITIPKDNSVFTRSSYEQVRFHILEGMLLAIITVLLFLGSWRTTLIAAVTIPTSIITTFIFMKYLNFSLNNLTMLAFSLMVGMLVDDAIVVLENIYRHHEMGKNSMIASREGAKEIGIAVLATTLTIVAVFIPVAFMKGIIGRFMYQYGITVVVGVSASYFVAISLAPMLASQFMKGGRDNFVLFNAFNRGFLRLEKNYETLIGTALRHKWLTVGIAFISMVIALGLFGTLKKEFQGNVDQSASGVSIEMPVGTSLASLIDFTAKIEDILKGVPEIISTYSVLGGGTLGEQNKGQINIQYVDKNKRNKTNLQMDDDLRKLLEGIPGAKLIVGEGGHFGTNYALQFELTGNDLNQLKKVSKQIADQFKTNPIFREVDTSYNEGKPEVNIQLDRDRIADLGLDAMTIGSTLRLFVSGEDTVTTYAEGGRQYDVIARLESKFRNRPEDIGSLVVYTNGKDSIPIPIESFAKVDVTSGPSEISHANKQRSISVLANIGPGHTTGDAQKFLDESIMPHLPPGITGKAVGETEIMVESFQSLGFALILGIVLIYLILAAQYNHFVHPLTIMTTLPVAFVGAFLLLFITKMTVSIFSIIGIIMLMGLVTKNAILVVEFTNQLRAKGMERDKALMTAGPTRLRPVLMTTMSTIVGMLPVALMLGGGAGTEMRAPMAVAVIGGLITSTLLTLVVTPVVYALFDNGTTWFLRVTGISKAYEHAHEDIPADQVFQNHED
jgi:hydrophobic/amphiphilic exporter-1 (mainly G- bacteria), HAE1 family